MSDDTKSFIKVPSGSKGIILPFSVFAILSGAFATGREVYLWYEARLAQAITRANSERDFRERVERLERWRCRQGYNPPETFDRNRDCSNSTIKKEREEREAAAPAPSSGP